MKTKIHQSPKEPVQDVCCPGFSSTRSIPQPHRKFNSAVELHLAGVEQIVSVYKGKLRPCGKGSFSFSRSSISRKEKRYNESSQGTIAIEFLHKPENSPAPGLETTKIYQKNQPSILLPCQDNRSVAKKSRVARGLTLHGKRRIEDACFLLERKFGIESLGFYTLTISLTKAEDVKSFNKVASLCLKRFMEKIKRIYERAGQRFSYVGVWEIHPSRSAKCGFPVIHFHYVANCYQSGTRRFMVTSSQIRNIWSRCVESHTGVRLARDCRIGSEVCKTSSAGYLAKYASKGVPLYSLSANWAGDVCLSSWFSISRNLLNCIDRCTTGLGDVVCGSVVRDFNRGDRNIYCSAFGVVERDIEGRACIVGYWLKLLESVHALYFDDYDTNILKYL